MWKYRVFPQGIDGNVATLLIDNEVYSEVIQRELEILTGYQVTLMRAKSEQISELLAIYYRKSDNQNPDSHFYDISDNSDFLEKLILEAKSLKSSDIHIESYASNKRIRLRIDGKLIQRHKLPDGKYASLINKIKIKSQLDIAEKRLPQDGRMSMKDDESQTDIRVSILPTLNGEKIVLRLLSNDSEQINLESIGFDDRQLKAFKNVLRKPHGIILISGPTGSGKTTTLYATLKVLNNEQNNILTIEDPIEYTLNGVNQVQLKENIGLTFANALKTFLRQDPDIIMLGEIRDSETAKMAIRAALTGHLVLSTIHTNSAWGTISRLVDMGIPNYLLANTINLTVAQRLVRKLCNECKEIDDKVAIDVYSLLGMSQEDGAIYKAKGCNNCYYTGYMGRIAVFEIIPIDSELSTLIKEHIQDISTQLKERKVSTLKESAIELVKTGMTSYEEIYPMLIIN